MQPDKFTLPPPTRSTASRLFIPGLTSKMLAQLGTLFSAEARGAWSDKREADRLAGIGAHLRAEASAAGFRGDPFAIAKAPVEPWNIQRTSEPTRIAGFPSRPFAVAPVPVPWPTPKPAPRPAPAPKPAPCSPCKRTV